MSRAEPLGSPVCERKLKRAITPHTHTRGPPTRCLLPAAMPKEQGIMCGTTARAHKAWRLGVSSCLLGLVPLTSPVDVVAHEITHHSRSTHHTHRHRDKAMPPFV